MRNTLPRRTLLICGFALASAAGGPAQGQGLSASSQLAAWPELQGRLSTAAAAPTSPRPLTSFIDDDRRVPGLSLMGDYYFAASPGWTGFQGGFRATSGMLWGPRTQLLGGQPGGGAGLGLGTPLVGADAGTRLPSDPLNDSAAQSYLGVGYTGISPHGGWSFSADLGVLGQNGAATGRLSRVFGASQNLYDATHDSRFAPVFQLGVRHPF